MQITQLYDQLKTTLSPRVYDHSIGVATTAARLAVKLGADQDKAFLAGLLHDCAREWPAEKLLEASEENRLNVDSVTRQQPVILHADVGAILAQDWGIRDDEVLTAIRNHTLGRPQMPLLAEIVYIADKIEPGRQYPGVDQIRKQAEEDFHECLMQVASQSVTYVLQKKQIVHPRAISFWNWLVERKNRGV
ncbi:MAG: bis(5'-nucleosyl)-tetraphosphatase (symmetrical) YqeK [Bacillota bacterium]|nr:bis(5'-nucleosyl)-tetraphosphatase (symmetrical) YqeK [Bacillota bacterium]MDW7683298.1 bis(5'-nucleosyl)-tetraphosphatase (symmetrical) YqeK [Bacillota bacterium]